MDHLHYFGAALGLGMIVTGAGRGIGRVAATTAATIPRPPADPGRIPRAVHLALGLLESVGILAERVGLPTV